MTRRSTRRSPSWYAPAAGCTPTAASTSTADYQSFGSYPIQRFPAVAALLRGYRVAAVVDRVTMYVPASVSP